MFSTWALGDRSGVFSTRMAPRHGASDAPAIETRANLEAISVARLTDATSP